MLAWSAVCHSGDQSAVSGSLQQHLHFGNTRLQPEDPPSHFEFISEDDGLYLYEDTRTGQEVWTTERIEMKSSDI